MKNYTTLEKIKERSKLRKSKITTSIVDLHDEDKNHSFHPEYTIEQAEEVMHNLKKQEWYRLTGKPLQKNVDKTVVKIITKEERYKEY